MNFPEKYNIDLCKGTGLIQESIILLELYQQGMSENDLANLAIENNVLVKNSNTRTKDIVKIAFFKRFIKKNPKTAVWLNDIIKKNLGLQVISQLFYIYTARSNKILKDFIVDVYWPASKRNINLLDTSNSRMFISNAISATDLIVGWSNSTQTKMASYLISTLVDFRLLDAKRYITPYYLHDVVANYLAHELHFNNVSDNGILNAEDWLLFGYSRADVISHLERISFKGEFILQSSGELINISWKHKTMEEFIDALR